MRKILAVVFFISFMVMDSGAQKFGVRTGFNSSTMVEEDFDFNYSSDYQMSNGFHFGPTAEFPISRLFSFETALLLSTKGFNYSKIEPYMGSFAEFRKRVTLYYIDVPLNLKVFLLAGDIKIYTVLGPYLGSGVFGTTKTAWDDAEYVTENIKWGSDPEEDNYVRIDYGFTAGAGLEFRALLLGLSYNLGIANTSPISDNGYKSNNKVLGVSLGYRFGNK